MGGGGGGGSTLPSPRPSFGVAHFLLTALVFGERQVAIKCVTTEQHKSSLTYLKSDNERDGLLQLQAV